MGKNLNDIQHDMGGARPANEEEHREIVRVLGEGAWMVGIIVIHIPVVFVKGVVKVVNVVIGKDD